MASNKYGGGGGVPKCPSPLILVLVLCPPITRVNNEKCRRSTSTDATAKTVKLVKSRNFSDVSVDTVRLLKRLTNYWKSLKNGRRRVNIFLLLALMTWIPAIRPWVPDIPTWLPAPFQLPSYSRGSSEVSSLLVWKRIKLFKLFERLFSSYAISSTSIQGRQPLWRILFLHATFHFFS